MAVFYHLVGASASGKQLGLVEFQQCIQDLLNEKLIKFPAAIFVGDAQANPDGYYWSTDAAYNAILPGSPGSMIELLEEYEDISSVETLCYDGNDETSFKAALESAPFGKKDICICFDLILPEGGRGRSRYGEGAVIYALARPFPVQYAALKSTFQHELSQFVVFYTSLGRNLQPMKPELRRILKRYFGEEVLLAESVDR
jgi:hypothetical protein